jgi:hypothetical protein
MKSLRILKNIRKITKSYLISIIIRKEELFLIQENAIKARDLHL